MFRRMRLWKALLAVAMLAFATRITAQQSFAPPMDAQRSYALQAKLQAIDADRAAWVDRFLASWALYVENTAYDVFGELRDIAMRAPAWQLYGASLVGDFNTMTQILMGQRGAGPYINSLAVPQEKIAIGPTWSMLSANSAGTSIPGPGTAVLGSYTDNLVFTPIAPCRIVDTRYTGARTGVIPANGSRNFDLTTDGYAKGQGGATSGCTGLPSYSYVGWAVNITVTGYSSTGGLKAWGYTGTEPNASIINYSATLGPAIANGLTLVGCNGCFDDITVKAFTSATHVIIDVVGYYRNAVATNATVSRFAGTPVVLVAGAFSFVDGGACPAGTVLVGGEIDHNGGDLAVGEYHEDATPTNWTFWMINNGGSATATAYSRCMDQPIIQ